MFRNAVLPRYVQPEPERLVRTRTGYALMRRRRSVLFAFTFSPPVRAH